MNYLQVIGLYLKRSVFFVTVVFIGALFYQYYFTSITVEADIETDRNNVFQLFWASQSHFYSEKDSFKFRIRPNQTSYRFQIHSFFSIDTLEFTPLITLKDFRYLRIDPMKRSGDIRIRKIIIRQNGYLPLRFETEEQLKRLIPSKDITEIDYHADGIHIVASGIDPQLDTIVTPRIDIKWLLFVFALVISLDFALKRVSANAGQKTEFNYAPYFMVFVCVLILAGGAICKQMHADEGHHLKAGRYYMGHWLPPKVCDPSVANTYSVYGVSRLDSVEIVYLFAGKFAQLIDKLQLNQFFQFRLFNISLFFILTLLSIRNVEYRILCLPLLVSPQIWYVFTYFNSEAFALFVIILIAYQAASDNSLLHYYLNEAESKQEIFRYAITLGLLFSLLLLIKLNFLVFGVFLVIVFLLKLIFKEFNDGFKAFKRLMLLLLIVISVWGGRHAIDVSINGFEKKDKCFECRKKMALPLYNPATPLVQRHLYLRLKERGVTVKELFEKWHWGYLSFWRAFGAYFFEPPAPDWYLRAVLAICVLFSFYLALSVFIRLQLEPILMFGCVLFCSMLLIALSIWNSWTACFQAHGRYLFPIFIMTGFFIFQSYKVINEKCINFFIFLMFGLSLYSYFWVGLLQLPKF